MKLLKQLAIFVPTLLVVGFAFSLIFPLWHEDGWLDAAFTNGDYIWIMAFVVAVMVTHEVLDH